MMVAGATTTTHSSALILHPGKLGRRLLLRYPSSKQLSSSPFCIPMSFSFDTGVGANRDYINFPNMVLASLLVSLMLVSLSLLAESFDSDALVTGVAMSQLGETDFVVRSRGESLSERAKSIRAGIDNLVGDAKKMSDRTALLSQAADMFIPGANNKQDGAKEKPAEGDVANRRLRRVCKSTECGVACLKDCSSQCKVARVLNLDVAGCSENFCPKTCAVGCTANPCDYRFVLVL